ncbi:hypothetical protein HYR54_05465 [Candidatus Acetothermia bacterium]|nr:hypothetical protein [Candidatus Acetothermia bacterium]
MHNSLIMWQLAKELHRERLKEAELLRVRENAAVHVSRLKNSLFLVITLLALLVIIDLASAAATGK